MGFRIVEIEELSGPYCKIYSIAYDGKGGDMLFDDFLDRMDEDYPDEVEDIWNKLQFMADEGGARLQFFRENEGLPGDGVVALLKESGFTLRLYAIRYGTVLLILGSGGYKDPSIKAWQDDEILRTHALEIEKISALITERIKNREIKICDDGTLEGDLYFDEEIKNQ